MVIASLPTGRYGTTPAATAAAQMLSSFPNIKFGLMVGIGGGIPNNDNDIRLGDVVVSQPEGSFGGVRQYDCGKATVHGFEERGALNSPPQVLLNAVSALQSKHEMTGSEIPSLLESILYSWSIYTFSLMLCFSSSDAELSILRSFGEAIVREVWDLLMPKAQIMPGFMVLYSTKL